MTRKTRLELLQLTIETQWQLSSFLHRSKGCWKQLFQTGREKIYVYGCYLLIISGRNY